MLRILSFLGVLCVIAALAASLSACPTSNCVIPTADILDAGTLRLDLENDGYPGVAKDDSTTYVFAQFGLTSRLELGIDNTHTTDDDTQTLNVKYLAVTESKLMPAVAVGITDMNKDQTSTLYAVGTKTFGDFRAHAGLIRADYAKGPMIGFDYTLPKGFCVMGDWIQGDNTYLTLGVSKEIAKDWSAMVMYGIANDHSESDFSSISISRTFSLGGGKN